MRIVALSLAAAFMVLAAAGFAQTDTTQGYIGAYAPSTPAPAFKGPLPEADTGAPGLDEEGPDGISTKVVRAVPCSTAARETDGSTTCVGIEPNAKRRP
jgi:hypothetical protein